MIRYIGKGFIIGIPQRDLTDQEAEYYGKRKILKSGIYKEVKVKIVEPSILAEEDKDYDLRY